MKYYMAEINVPCLNYGYSFLVRAENKKDAQQKIYDCCKDDFDYKKSEILIYSLEELYKASDNLDVVMLN